MGDQGVTRFFAIVGVLGLVLLLVLGICIGAGS